MLKDVFCLGIYLQYSKMLTWVSFDHFSKLLRSGVHDIIFGIFLIQFSVYQNNVHSPWYLSF